jgi:hypothetical protein
MPATVQSAKPPDDMQIYHWHRKNFWTTDDKEKCDLWAVIAQWRKEHSLFQ